jgi:two-component system sensor histidine kinase UhpB
MAQKTIEHPRSGGEEKSLRVLILEDIPADAELVELELRKAGILFSARRVETENEFFKEIENFRPDIVLADYTLPQFTGLEALKLLKTRQSELPFILVTGAQSEEVAVECMKEGADDYILKSSLRRLPSAFLNVLAKKEAEIERKKVEAALRRSEERYRLITENSRDLICLLDMQGNIVYASPASQDILGYSAAECTMNNFYSLIHPDDRRDVIEAVQGAMKTNGAIRLEFRYNHKAGQWRILESVWSKVAGGSEKSRHAVIICRDITERKRSEEQLRRTGEQLRALSARLQSIREEERTRIAREIHDELGQVLTALKIDVSVLERKVSGGLNGFSVSMLKGELSSIGKLIDTTIHSVRRIATELRPDVLDSLGLSEAILWQAQEFQTRNAIQCRVNLPPQPLQLDQERATAIFRIFQEALTNVVRHANATQVDVAVEEESGMIVLRVKDNGKGIAEGEIFGTKSLGLLGMRERSHLLGGEVSISGHGGEGTVVTVQVPLQRVAEERQLQ